MRVSCLMRVRYELFLCWYGRIQYESKDKFSGWVQWGVLECLEKLHGQICQVGDTKWGDFVKVIGIQSEVLNVRNGAGVFSSLLLSLNSVTKISLSSFSLACLCLVASKVQHWDWLLASLILFHRLSASP